MKTLITNYDYESRPDDQSPFRRVSVTVDILDAAGLVTATYSASTNTDTTIAPADIAPILIGELVGQIKKQYDDDQAKKANLDANLAPFAAAFQQSLDAALFGGI